MTVCSQKRKDITSAITNAEQRANWYLGKVIKSRSPPPVTPFLPQPPTVLGMKYSHTEPMWTFVIQTITCNNNIIFLKFLDSQ